MDKLPEEEREKDFATMIYYELALFVYEPLNLFDKYEVAKMEIQHYQIDFRKTYTVQCGKIKRKEKLKKEDIIILDTKITQITVPAREDLRMKLSEFYSRIPEEDKIILDELGK